jgi:hypothetical protein
LRDTLSHDLAELLDADARQFRSSGVLVLSRENLRRHELRPAAATAQEAAKKGEERSMSEESSGELIADPRGPHPPSGVIVEATPEGGDRMTQLMMLAEVRHHHVVEGAIVHARREAATEVALMKAAAEARYNVLLQERPP